MEPEIITKRMLGECSLSVTDSSIVPTEQKHKF